jgi:MSHA biogenesis protein MshI
MDGVTQPRPAIHLKHDTGLRRWLQPAAASKSAQVGLQFVGERLLFARLRHTAGEVEIEALRSIAAPAAQRPAALRALKQEGLFRDARVHFLLTPGQYDVHQLAAPAVPAEDLRDALRWQLRSSLGYPPEEALLDVASLPQPADAPARQSLLAVTARRSVVVEAIAPLVACGLAVDAVDVPEFAQRNLAQRILADENATHGWLAFDQDTFLLTTHCLGELAFARRMLLPNAALNAENDADPVAHFVERVVVQVQRSLDLFERQSGLPPVTQVVVGAHPHAPAIAAELGQKAAVRVLLADSAELLRRAAAFGPEVATGEAMAVLGAALRPQGDGAASTAQQIDLRRIEKPAAKGSGSRLPAVLAVLALAVGLVAHLWLETQALDVHKSTAARLRHDVQRAEHMLVSLGAQAPAQASALAGAEADVAALEALAARLAGGTLSRAEPFTEPLRAFARARTEGVWLTGIRLNNASGQLVLEGKALEAAHVPQLLAALQREPRFAGTEFARIEMQPAQEPAGAVQFRISSSEATAAAANATTGTGR